MPKAFTAHNIPRRPQMHQGLTFASRSTCISSGIARSCSCSTACQARKIARRLRHCMSAAHTTNAMTATTESDAEPTVSALAAEDLVQYVVLRKDLWDNLQWPLGSIIAQACHASTAALWLSRESDETLAYCSAGKLDHMHKVVLEVKGEQQLQNLSNRLKENRLGHQLWVEQPENFVTCLATVPCSKAKVQQYFKKFQLCKGI